MEQQQRQQLQAVHCLRSIRGALLGFFFLFPFDSMDICKRKKIPYFLPPSSRLFPHQSSVRPSPPPPRHPSPSLCNFYLDQHPPGRSCQLAERTEGKITKNKCKSPCILGRKKPTWSLHRGGGEGQSVFCFFFQTRRVHAQHSARQR